MFGKPQVKVYSMEEGRYPYNGEGDSHVKTPIRAVIWQGYVPSNSGEVEAMENVDVDRQYHREISNVMIVVDKADA